MEVEPTDQCGIGTTTAKMFEGTHVGWMSISYCDYLPPSLLHSLI